MLRHLKAQWPFWFVETGLPGFSGYLRILIGPVTCTFVYSLTRVAGKFAWNSAERKGKVRREELISLLSATKLNLAMHPSTSKNTSKQSASFHPDMKQIMRVNLGNSLKARSNSQHIMQTALILSPHFFSHTGLAITRKQANLPRNGLSILYTAYRIFPALWRPLHQIFHCTLSLSCVKLQNKLRVGWLALSINFWSMWLSEINRFADPF